MRHLALALLVSLLLIAASPLLPPPASHAQEPPTPSISRLQWSADGTHLLAVIDPMQVIYDVSQPTAAPLVIDDRLSSTTEVWGYYATTFSADNTLFAFNLNVYDTATGEVVYTLTMPQDRDLMATAFSPNGQWVAYGDGYGYLHIADAHTGQPIRLDLNNYAEAGLAPNFNIVGLLFAPDSSWLAVADWGSTITLWDTATWEVINMATPYSSKAQYGLTLSPDARLLVTQDSFSFPHVWDVATMTETVPAEGAWLPANGVGFIGATPVFVYSDAETSAPVFLNPLDETPLEVDFGSVTLDPEPFGTRSWVSGTSITLYDYPTDRAYRYDLSDATVTEVGPVGYPVAVSPDGRHMAAVDTDGALTLWNWDTATQVTLPLPTITR